MALAGSHSDFGFSPFVGAEFQHQNKWFSVNAHTLLAGKHFTQISIQPDTLTPRQISNASTSIKLWKLRQRQCGLSAAG